MSPEVAEQLAIFRRTLIAVITEQGAQIDRLHREADARERNAFELGRDHQRHVVLDAFAEDGHPATCECGDPLDELMERAVT